MEEPRPLCTPRPPYPSRGVSRGNVLLRVPGMSGTHLSEQTWAFRVDLPGLRKDANNCLVTEDACGFSACSWLLADKEEGTQPLRVFSESEIKAQAMHVPVALRQGTQRRASSWCGRAGSPGAHCSKNKKIPRQLAGG